MRRALAVAATAWAAALAVALPASAASPTVLLAEVDGVITPVVADYLTDAVAKAEERGVEALLVEMDTPGGLDTSMRQIVKAFLGARVPVVVSVAPQGARAASAGAIIGMSAHVLAMAPGTAIGAATPVDLQGGDISRKIINDAAAYARSIARARGRSEQFAADAVLKGTSIPAEEAVEQDVADLIAPRREALLERLHGRTVRLAGGSEATLQTRDAAVVRDEMSLFRRILQWLADPNLAFLFMSIGTLAIIYELANPGIGAGGFVGTIMVVLAMFALSVLPVNVAGVVFLVLAAALFVGEIFTPGTGIMAAGGTASLVLGGLFLFEGSLSVDLGVLVPVVVVVGLGVVLAGRLAWRSRSVPAHTGAQSLIGETGTVRVAASGKPQMQAQGTWWGLTSRAGELATGTRVRVVGMEGLDLVVEPVEEERND